MNKSQRMVAGIVLILMGVITFFLIASNIYSYSFTLFSDYFRRSMFKFYPIIVLGMAFIGAGIFVLVSKKRKGE